MRNASETTGPIETAVKAAARVLAERPSAFVSDIDGTISPIVSRPEDAVVSESARESLRRLARSISLVAVITGREESVARRMVGLAELTYVGNYALDGATATLLSRTAVDRAKDAIRPLLRPLPCVTLEEKGVSFTLHYRNCDDPGIREQLLSLIRPITEADRVRIVEGKQVIEIVPEGLPDKGTAISRLLREKSISGAVYMGDDLSDVPVFEEIRRRRTEDRLRGLSVAIVDEETGESVLEAADLCLRSVDETEVFLSQLARYLEKEGAP